MKKNLLLFLSIFIISLSSNAMAEEGVARYQQSYSQGFEKYNAYSSTQKNLLSATNTAEDEVYELIYNAFMNLSSSIDLSTYDMSSDQVFSIRKKVLYDHPEIFYLDYENSFYWTNGELEFKYIDTDVSLIAMKNELNTKVENILSDIIKPNMTEFQKELAIHDYIVLNTRYDEENYNNNTIPRDSYTTYGILVKGVGVCQGYAETFKLLLREVGIDSTIVSSEPMNHAWNIVNIDGENYQVDVTWNDKVPDRKGKTGYEYLNLTDSEMKKDHNWDYSKYLASTSTKYSYMWEIDSPITDGSYKYYSSSEDRLIYRLDENLNKQRITSARAPYFDIAGEDIYFSNYDDSGYLFKVKKDGTSEMVQLNSTHSIDIYRDDNYIYYTEAKSGIKKSIKVDIVEPEIKIESVSLDKTSLNLVVGQGEKLIAKIFPDSATNKKVYWSSGNTNVATVDNSGNVKAISSGETNIIVTTEDGLKSASCTVIVKDEQFNTPLDKVWTVTFNKEVDEESINNSTIYVVDDSNNKVELNYEASGKQVKLIPVINYMPNKIYTLFITTGVKSNNKSLVKPVEKKFDTYKTN